MLRIARTGFDGPGKDFQSFRHSVVGARKHRMLLVFLIFSNCEYYT